MADIKLIVKEPDVGFDAYASRLQCRVQWYPAPVVVMGVAANRDYIAGDIGGPARVVYGASAVGAI